MTEGMRDRSRRSSFIRLGRLLPRLISVSLRSVPHLFVSHSRHTRSVLVPRPSLRETGMSRVDERSDERETRGE